MNYRIIAGAAALLVLAGCESRYNPGNWGWFSGGGGKQETLEPRGGYEDPSDRRPFVTQVTDVRVERVAGGAIVTAVGLPPTQGYWEADLVPAYTTVTGKPAARDGVMWLEFRAIGPLTPHPVGTPLSREVVTGVFLTDQALANAGRIVVVAEGNERIARR